MAFLVVLLLLSVVIAAWLWIKRADADFTLIFLSWFGRSSDSLRGKVVWVTGASSGIGECLAYELASAGAHLALSGTNLDRLELVHKKCQDLGRYHCSKVLTVAFNISDVACHEEKVKMVTDFFGPVDILVNNAGKWSRQAFQDGVYEDDKELFDLNVFGPVSLTRLLLKHSDWSGRRLHIAVTSSIAVVIGSGMAPTYAATKHALQGYFDGLRLVGLMSGRVDVTVVYPGPVLTPLLKDSLSEAEGTPNIRIMSAKRCAQLYVVALTHKVAEAWLCDNPVLLLLYVSQYMPTFYKRYAAKLIPWNQKGLRRGRN